MAQWRMLTQFIVFILCLFVMLWQPSMVNGEERLELSIDVGFGNEIKEGSWVPIRVTMTNNGPPLAGDVFVQFDNNAGYGNWTGTAKEHVELPQGATKQVTLILPSERLHGGNKVIFTVDEDKVAEARISGNWTGRDTLSIGVLSTAAEAGAFLHGLGSGNTSVFTLQPDDMPDVGIALSGLDVLVVNNFPVDQLNTNQIEAIKRWVASGGTLILGGGPEYDKAAQAFHELSPVEVSGTTQIETIDALQQKQYEEKLSLQAPLTISDAELKRESDALILQNEMPIIARQSWQEGEVIFTAYDLTAAPLSEWQGNATLWDSLLVNSRQSIVYQDSYPWSLLNAVDNFPSMELPSVGVIAVAFLLYTLLIGPILYLILRKWDKRSWAWGIIPLSALLVALVIYAYGAGVRGNEIMTHQVNVLKLHTNGTAEVRGATGVFVPDGGSYELQLPPGFVGWPTGNDYSPTTVDWNQFNVRISTEGTYLNFKDVEYWSLRKAFVEGQVEVGPIVADLMTADGRIVGTVTNESRLDLHDVSILTGGNKEELGTLKAGETKQIDVEQGVASSMGGRGLVGQSFPSRDGDQRKQMLLSYLEYDAYPLQLFQFPVQLVGWTEEPVIDSSVQNKSVESHALSLVVSPLHVKAGKDGKVAWPEGLITPEVVAAEGLLDISADGFAMRASGGTVTLRYDLNTEEKVSFEKLLVDFQGTATTLEWLNQETGAWEDVDDESAASSPNVYVSESGVVLLRISRDAGDEHFYLYPTLEAEGTVVK